MSPMNIFLLICMVVALELPIVHFVLTRRLRTLRCDALLRRLHPYQLSGRERFLNGAKSKRFYEETDGALGLWYRWQNQAVLLALCQIRVLHHGLDADDIGYVAERCAKLTARTGLALCLYPFRKFTPLAENAARSAFVLYGEIAHRTLWYFSTDDTPFCSVRLASLL